MRKLLIILLFCGLGHAQENSSSLTELRKKLDSLVSFEASIRLETDISFVNMPVKQARIKQLKNQAVEIDSDDFIMIPKRGLDFTFNELFSYPFMSINMGKGTVAGILCDIVKIIPEDTKADFSIATLYIDPARVRVLQSEISTKKNGVFQVEYEYGSESAVLPSEIVVEFEVSEIKIPLRFLAKDSNIDRSALKQEKEQTGRIIIQLSDFKIVK